MNRSDKIIKENKNICRPTLVFYVIHYYIFFIKKKKTSCITPHVMNPLFVYLNKIKSIGRK